MISGSVFPDLRYLPASLLRGAGVNLNRVPVETDEHQPVGALAGVLVDPATRRLRYLVVEGSRWLAGAWRVVPFTVATVDAARGALCVEKAAVDDCVEFEPAAITGGERAAS
jgi:hypothetical protein